MVEDPRIVLENCGLFRIVNVCFDFIFRLFFQRLEQGVDEPRSSR